ncbi:cysteinyl-tRNA synthetase [Actibacterium atlanticum]|uniref:Cysteine--tRNA ligase n=1 Tax=Actibacterium atlanticum TaxID=1461693 RepID=A0A058ZPQ1_9RHOB|nr:cysteine--tRNA ligase [Actibacterium atlanticum]KCV83574.1 cysteinyl-tRNA synthetase [Actibacterium atlanticum]
MTKIKLHNTLTRRKEDFAPIEPDNVRMYVCGPTVYDRAHLGNARPVVVFDVLYRLLRHVYGPDHVTYVRNFTDVDDKINARALENVGEGGDVNAEIARLTGMTTQWFLDDMQALGALDPSQMPRATQYIPQMIAMIEKLIAEGYAYAKDGHALFRVRKYAEYGKLSGRSVDDMIAGARVEVAPYKEDPMDFVLWKPSSDDLPGWDSPWGRGRPGWHIECSAMSYELLGAEFDIHGGGNDLMFPHHENEMAQSCCAHPEGGFAKFWLHNEMLQVEGKKMSKSLGNFFTVHDLLEGHDGQPGVPGEVIRFVFLSTHYRKPMDWTAEKAREAEATLRKWRGLVAGIEPAPSPAPEVTHALADDLNTAGAIAALHKLAAEGDAAGLKASAALVGLLGDDLGDWANASGYDDDLVDLVAQLLAARAEARKNKEWSKADLIRDGFKEAGIKVKDSPEGTTWSIERDEIDSLPFFHSVRHAFQAGDQRKLEEALEVARQAGIVFSDRQSLDVAPAWRSEPEPEYVKSKLVSLIHELNEIR